VGTEFGKQLAEITAPELPLERAGDGFVVLLEVQETCLELPERRSLGVRTLRWTIEK
jgi:hypothetical protein